MTNRNKFAGGDNAPKAKFGCTGCAFFFVGLFIVLALAATVVVTRWQSQSLLAANEELGEIRDANMPASGEELNNYADNLAAGDVDATPLWVGLIDRAQRVEFRQDVSQFPFEPWGSKPVPFSGEPWDEENQATEFLTKHADFVAAIYAAADAGGTCRFAMDYRESYVMLLPHVEEVRNLARLISLDAAIHARNDESEKFASAIEVNFSIGNTLQHEPLLISNLVRIAVHGIAIENVRRVLSRFEISPSNSRRLRTLLLSQDYQPQLKQAFIGERSMAIDVFLNPEVTRLVLDSEMTGAPIPRLPTRYAELTNYLRWMNPVVEAMDLDYREAAIQLQRLDDEFQTFSTNMSGLDKFQNIMVMLLYPSTPSAHAATGRILFQTRACATALAIEEFRQNHQRIPDELGALVPEYLDSVPLDPYTSKPLKYIPDGDTYRLYSVGADMTDNGGTAGRSQTPDIVFSVPSEPPEDESDE